MYGLLSGFDKNSTAYCESCYVKIIKRSNPHIAVITRSTVVALFNRIYALTQRKQNSFWLGTFPKYTRSKNSMSPVIYKCNCFDLSTTRLHFPYQWNSFKDFCWFFQIKFYCVFPRILCFLKTHTIVRRAMDSRRIIHK